MESTTSSPRSRPRRWRPRFSLRGLLIVMTALAVWFGFCVNRARNERLAAEAVEGAAGKILYDWQAEGLAEPSQLAWLRRALGPHFFDRIVRVEFDHRPFHGFAKTSDVLGRLAPLSLLREVSLVGVDFRLSEYQALGRLKRLEKLRIQTKETLNKQNAAEFVSLRALNELSLRGTTVTTPALVEIAKLSRLQVLSVGFQPTDSAAGQSVGLNDDAARAIAGCESLKDLDLSDTVITDEGAAELCRLTNLRTLSISSPNLTGKSLRGLQRLDKLVELCVDQWRIAEVDIAALGEMRNLTFLSLFPAAPLTDADLECFARLEQLEHLVTTCSEQFTGEGLKHLRGLSNLQSITLYVPAPDKLVEAKKQLEQDLPNCLIGLFAF